MCVAASGTASAGEVAGRGARGNECACAIEGVAARASSVNGALQTVRVVSRTARRRNRSRGAGAARIMWSR